MPASTGSATSCSPPCAPARSNSGISTRSRTRWPHYGVTLDDIRRRLHATDEAGRLIVGADVALALWKLTPGEGWLAALLGNRVMLPLTRFVYDRFADVLFAWNKRRGRW